MLTAVEAIRPLNEAVWQAWVAKGRTQEQRGRALRLRAVTWVSIAALLAAAGLWARLTPYDVVVRFVIFGGAIVLMAHEFRAGHGVFAVVFGWLALMYNPVAPMFDFSGGWQRAFVAASAVPFAASLAWTHQRMVPND